MAIININQLRQAFSFGKKPSASDFENLIDTLQYMSPEQIETLAGIIGDTKVVQKNGSSVEFTIDANYGTPTEPITGNITQSLTGAVLGATIKIFHNAGAEPSYPAGWVKKSEKNYVPNQLNRIYAQYEDANNIIYTIA